MGGVKMNLESWASLIPGRKRREGERPFCTAVIVAAGNSRRMGNDKIFTALGGLPVLVRSIRAFEENELVDEIIVVTREEKLEHVAELVKKYGLQKVSKAILGGRTRVESCLAGVSEADHRAGLIAIHDGARPLVTQAVIRCDRSCRQSGKPLGCTHYLDDCLRCDYSSRNSLQRQG